MLMLCKEIAKQNSGQQMEKQRTQGSRAQFLYIFTPQNPMGLLGWVTQENLLLLDEDPSWALPLSASLKKQ